VSDEILDPDQAIATYMDPVPAIERWIANRLQAGQSRAEVAGDLRRRAERYAPDSPAHGGLRSMADEVEAGSES
jgi:hypothetical protein